MSQNEYAGRVVVITGGGGGAGQTVSRRWLEAGAFVFVADAAQPALDALRGIWQNTPGSDPTRLQTFVGDLTTEAGANEMAAQARQAFGAVPDTLVHLVGGYGMGPIDAPDAPQMLAKMLVLNLHTAFYCCRALLPGMKERRGGWIVGIASKEAVAPSPRFGAYAASKAALVAMLQSLAGEVKYDNIHVNVILPSIIDTPANRQSAGDRVADNWVKPDDIADAALYLCSERARSVYGATLELYGKV